MMQFGFVDAGLSELDGYQLLYNSIKVMFHCTKFQDHKHHNRENYAMKVQEYIIHFVYRFVYIYLTMYIDHSRQYDPIIILHNLIQHQDNVTT